MDRTLFYEEASDHEDNLVIDLTEEDILEIEPLMNTGPNANSSRQVKTELRIPRPPNAFILFGKEWRRKLQLEHPSEKNTFISKRLGVMWKNMSEKEKQIYYSASREASELHKLQYPGYSYNPQAAKRRKAIKRKLANAKKFRIKEQGEKNMDKTPIQT